MWAKSGVSRELQTFKGVSWSGGNIGLEEFHGVDERLVKQPTGSRRRVVGERTPDSADHRESSSFRPALRLPETRRGGDSGLMGIFFGGSPATGPFELMIDDVRFLEQ
jgi:hypothetical protein